MKREGEVALAVDPAGLEPDAGIVFIGRVNSPWRHKDDCPKNMAQAHERGGGASIEIAEPYRQGLDGLEAFGHVVVLTWLDRARRDLVVQHPRHAERARGVFSLRSPVRPNPIGLHVVRLEAVDRQTGRLSLAAIDVLDGTPVIDVKPYYASVDAVGDA